jgi:heme-degrading monooxygenase HmoA
MMIVLIRTRMRDDADLASYGRLSARMEELVQGLPGYLSAKGYRSEDGDEVAMIRFADAEALRAWRDHPEHREVQRLGREQFYAAYDIEVCEVTRAYSFGPTAPDA